MVLVKKAPEALVSAPYELRLESKRTIRFVAPKNSKIRTDTSGIFDRGFGSVRKNSAYDAPCYEEEWDAVNMMCQYLDMAIDVDKEVELFEGKTILELGFASGLPSVFALDNGAIEVTVHSQTESEMECFIKPTLLRNSFAKNKCKFSCGDYQDLIKSIGNKKFDVVLAVEPLRCAVSEIQKLHDVLDAVLAEDGICIMTSRNHTFHYDASVPVFRDLVKRIRTFDYLERWSSHSEVLPWKVIQLTRSVF